MSAKIIRYHYNSQFLADESGARLNATPILTYKEQPVWEIHALSSAAGGGVSTIDLSSPVSWRAAVDTDFDYNSPPMCRSLASDIDAADAANGVIRVSLDADTITFRDKVNNSNNTRAWFELQGFDSLGRRRCYVRFPITASSIIDSDDESTLLPPSDAASKSWTLALLNTKANASDIPSDLAELSDSSGILAAKQDSLGFTPENTANKGSANGYAELDASGKVPSSQLPGFVDDVLEYANLASFPAPGESGKIYVALDTNLTYRWSGSAYVEISPSLALGETSATAYRGDRGKTAYDHSQTTGNPHNTDVANLADASGLLARATQAEAEAGTDNNKLMTPLRVSQAIAKTRLGANTTYNIGTAGKPTVQITDISANGSIADAAVTGSHSFAVGDTINIDETTNFNGSFVLTAVNSTTLTWASTVTAIELTLANTYARFVQTVTAAEIQATINSIPKNLNGFTATLTFRDGYYNLASNQLNLKGFGNGALEILSSTGTMYEKPVKISGAYHGTNGMLSLFFNSCYVILTRLTLENRADGSGGAVHVINTSNSSALIRLSRVRTLIPNCPSTSFSSGIMIYNLPQFTCEYVSNEGGQFGLYAQSCFLSTVYPGTTGTRPAYGLKINGAIVVGSSPTGTIAAVDKSNHTIIN